MTTHTKVETELIPFSCAYGECDHKREDECPALKDFICQECTDALDDDAACVLWEDYDHQVALSGSAERAPWTDATPSEVRAIVESHRSADLVQGDAKLRGNSGDADATENHENGST